MKRQIMGLALAVALLGAGQAQALLIDDYSDSNLPQTCDAYGSKATGQCVAQPDFFTTTTPNLDTGLVNVVGGSRLLDILQTSGSLSPSAGANVNGIDGLLYNNGSSVTSKLTMTWDANGSGLGGGKGVDLTSNTLPATFADGSPTPSGPAEYLRWQITAMDINLLATVLLTDADGTTAGNAFLKLPSAATDPAGGVAGVCTASDFLVCVQPSVPGNLYHALSLFNSGGTDPATGVAFFDDPYSAGSLAPSGGDGDLDLDKITKIVVIFDTSGNTGTDGLDLTETCFDTVPLLGTPVANPPGVAGPGNNIGSSVCSTSAIPEPSTVLLMGTGLLGVGLLGVRSRFSQRRRQA